MSNMTIRCLVALAWGVPLACYSGAAPREENADEVDPSDSTDSGGSLESMGTTDSGESTESTDATDDSEGTTESSESDDGSEDSTTEDESTTTEPPPDLPPIDPNETIPPPDEEGCHAIYAQDLLPTFDLVLEPEVWELLQEDWLNGPELNADDEEYNPKRPVAAFLYEDIVIYDATVRVRGNPTFWDADDKVQLHLDFNDVDPDGRFLGLRHLAFDAATANQHMLRDRLALKIMRDMGIPATCANHARLNINNEYYGIFTNLEKLDKEYLQRVFDDPDGDLWDRHNWELKTNEETSNSDRLDELLDADSISDLAEYLDLEWALRVFAAEAIIPNGDGPWAGGLNFFLYDDPITGKFLMLPWDLDATFERFDGPPESDYPITADPVIWEKPTTHGRPWYDMALDEDDWFDYYIGAIDDQFQSSYDADELHDLVDLWTDQISPSVLEDENKPYSNSVYWDEVEELHDFIDDRYDFLDEWLECWQDGGEPNMFGYCIPA
jgi:hypothetical protein